MQLPRRAGMAWMGGKEAFKNQEKEGWEKRQEINPSTMVWEKENLRETVKATELNEW